MSHKYPLCCFCGKYQHEVFLLIAGPTAYICDECVALSVELIAKKRTESK